MTCRSCGAVIAEKAIVCYKCGVPVAAPVTAPPRSSAPSGAGMLPRLLRIGAVACLVVAATVPGPWTDAAHLSLAGAAVAGLVASFALRS